MNKAYGRWIYCNDDSVSYMSSKDVVTKDAYMLFYKLQNSS